MTRAQRGDRATFKMHVMGETLRQRLKRRVWLAYGGCSLVLILWWLAMQYIVHPPGWMQSRYAVVPEQGLHLAFWYLLPTTVCGAWLFAIIRGSCPRCGKYFRYQFALRAGFGKAGSEPKACPSCGFSLDEPLPP
jgi:hypothetical protein